MIRRGEIYLVAFDPVRGSEANKTRPAIVVSNDGSNIAVERRNRGVIVVVPLTTNTSRILSFQLVVPATASGLRFDSKAQPEQIRAMDVARFGARVGRVSAAIMAQVEQGIAVHLGLTTR